MTEHVHEMPEQQAAEVIELEKEEAAEVLEEAREGHPIPVVGMEVIESPVFDEAELALRQFFGLPVLPEHYTEADYARQREVERLERHRAFVLGLRALADLYQAHPEINLPEYFGAFTIYAIRKEDLPKYARAFGSLEKVYGPSAFKLVKDFGGDIKLQTYSNRDSVCERVKVGEKLVPAHVIPAKPAEDARIVEEEVVGVYEWKCPEISLLRPTEAAESTAGDVEAIPEFISESPAADDDQPF